MIKNIIIGWYRRLFKKLEPWELDRLKKCNECTNKIKIGPEWICKSCGCPIKSKCRVKEEICLMNKW